MSKLLSKSQLDEFNTRQSDMIANLMKLQDQEMELYRQLQANVANDGDMATRDNLVSRIDVLAETRMDLYRDLMDNYSIIQNNVSQTRGNLIDQMTLIGVVQQQLDNLKKQTGELAVARNDKERMIEINTYYGEKYMAQKELMQLIILTCIPLLVLALLSKFGTLGNEIAGVLGGIVLVVGLYYIVKKIIDIVTRSNMDFQEYDWAYDPAALKPTVIEYDMEQLGLGGVEMPGASSLELSCYGQACCANGTVFDESKHRCVAAGHQTQSMVKQD